MDEITAVHLPVVNVRARNVAAVVGIQEPADGERLAGLGCDVGAAACVVAIHVDVVHVAPCHIVVRCGVCVDPVGLSVAASAILGNLVVDRVCCANIVQSPDDGCITLISPCVLHEIQRLLARLMIPVAGDHSRRVERIEDVKCIGGYTKNAGQRENAGKLRCQEGVEIH